MTALAEQMALSHPPRTARFTALVVVGGAGLRHSVINSLLTVGARDVAEAASAAEARARALSGGPRDLCVVDASLPDGSGLGLVAELRSAGWSHGLVLSAHEDPYTVRAALAAGIRCFLVNPAQGDLPVANAARRSSGADTLSAREIEVVDLVAQGQSNKEIGEKLGLSALTVKSHLARIARKLGTGDRAEMVMVALRAGIIS